VARVRRVSRRPVAMVRGHHDHRRGRGWRRYLASPLWRVRGQMEVERRERLGWRGGVGRLGRGQRATAARTGLHREPGLEHGNSPGESRHCQQQGGNGRLPDRGVVDPVPELPETCRPPVPHDSRSSIKSSASLPTRTRRQTRPESVLARSLPPPCPTCQHVPGMGFCRPGARGVRGSCSGPGVSWHMDRPGAEDARRRTAAIRKLAGHPARRRDQR
jgi:hypothetical protein